MEYPEGREDYLAALRISERRTSINYRRIVNMGILMFIAPIMAFSLILAAKPDGSI